MIYPKIPILSVGVLLVALFFGGCAAYRPLQIEPLAKNGAVVAPRFQEAYYYFDREHTLFFVMRSKTVDKATSKTVEQFATFRVFWYPVGGRTTMDPTALNATYRYVVISGNVVGMYEGAGFVRLWDNDGDHRMRARLMDGDLRLTEASAGFVDTIGRSRVRGNFSAIYDDAKALDMLLATHQEFFARSLNIKPVEPTSPALSTTRPSTSRPAPVDFPTTPSLPGMSTTRPVTTHP
jgi:hypothetical protein